MDRKYQIEDAARTLVKAEEIRGDRRLFAAAKRELISQQAALKKAVKK